MKHTITLPRHCERSAAIQIKKTGLPRHLRLLAMTMAAIFLPALAQAMQPCDEKYTFDYNIKNADIVFEGHFLKSDLFKLYDKREQALTYFSQTFVVDKNWKGTKAGEEVVAVVWLPLDENSLSMQEKDPDFLNKTMVRNGAQIIVLQEKSKLPNGPYLMANCEAQSYDATPDKIKSLEQKFPQGAAQ